MTLETPVDPERCSGRAQQKQKGCVEFFFKNICLTLCPGLSQVDCPHVRPVLTMFEPKVSGH